MCDDAALEFEGRVRRVIGSGIVGATLLIPAARNVRRAKAGHRLHLTENIVENVPPVAQHIDDDAAAVLFPIVPGRALARDGVALKDPVAKLAAYGKNVAEESFFTEALQLH